MEPQDFKSDVLSTGHAASSVANVPCSSRYLRRHVEFKNSLVFPLFLVQFLLLGVRYTHHKCPEEKERKHI